MIEGVINTIVGEIPVLYDKEVVRINIHQLTHLISSDIKLWGPLWTHSSFTFESMNGVLTSLIHGTQTVPKSAIYTLLYMQNDPFKNIQIKFKNHKAAALYQKFQTYKKK